MNETGHPTATELYEAAALGSPGGHARHLEQCLECRVRMNRLMHGAGAIGSPSEDALVRILGGPVRVSAAATATGDDGEPQPGEVWRTAGDPALLVWVRKLLDGAVDVVPATLDTDFADEYTVLVPADQTGLDVGLALFTALRGHIHPDALLTPVSRLGGEVVGQVEDAIRASRDGRLPEGLRTGPRIYDDEDQIVEYQQLLADMLADLGPASWHRTPLEPPTSLANDGEVVRILKTQLVERHRCRIYRSIPAVAMLPNGAVMTSVARVAFADTSLVVAELPDWPSVGGEHLAVACRRILDQEPGAHAVAVCASDPDRETIVVRAADTREAYEPPVGTRVPPRLPREPLPLIDALAKYLDAAAPAWQDADVSAALPSVDLATVAATAARAALADVVTQGSRARTPAKSEAWTSLTPHTADAVRAAVARIASGAPIGDVLDELLDGEK